MCIKAREVVLVEYDTAQNWYAQLPNHNWLCAIISDNRERRYLEEVSFIKSIIPLNVSNSFQIQG